MKGIFIEGNVMNPEQILVITKEEIFKCCKGY